MKQYLAAMENAQNSRIANPMAHPASETPTSYSHSIATIGLSHSVLEIFMRTARRTDNAGQLVLQ